MNNEESLEKSNAHYADYAGETFDRALGSICSKYTGWFSPIALTLAYISWFSHMAASPAKIIDINNQLINKSLDIFQSCVHDKDVESRAIKCKPNDMRFKHPGWREYPFNLYARVFLMYEELWDLATRDIRGVSEHHNRIINFMSRQLLDMLSPSNIPWLNPEIIETSIAQQGANFGKGMMNFHEDVQRILKKLPPAGTELFKVGKDVAITPGKVVYKNDLIELIQYKATTNKVLKEPILIVPAWIMKYYILDLSPHNSMVKYLVEQGHTVFMISWKNPDSKYRDLELNAYIERGIMAALDVINKIIPDTKINAVGYCIGGTVLSIAAAAMAGKGDNRLNSITLLAAQVDFRAAGELLLFIDPSQIAYLEDIMWENGYLTGSEMGGAFSMLHSVELVWSRVIREYLLGSREPMFDLMAWDYDATRLPYRMHSEYLRKLFLKNELVQGGYIVDDKPVALPDIRIPIFAVSTLTDHVAPWQSVYKIHLFTKSDITFVLTNGGHNAGIVSEPGHEGRNFQMLTTPRSGKRLTVTEWQQQANSFDGSWWPEWDTWLREMSGAEVNIPTIGDPNLEQPIICDAPGTYVLQK